jgi:lysophospholipase L1-like esterase
VPFERFKINLQKILEVAQKHKSKIVFIGIIPHDEGKLSPLPWEHDLYQKDEYIIKYNEAIKEFCQKKELPFLNLLEQLGADFVKFSQDGCHPNSEGHKVIYDCVKKFLLDNKLI